MAIRNIDTELWNDPKITDKFTHYDKYFWLFLLTTRYGNLAGCFEISIKQMQTDLGLPLNQVKEQVKRFIEYGIIYYDEETNEILIINYYKYNWSKSPKFIKAVEKQAQKIKNQFFKEYILNVIKNGESDIRYRYGIDTVSIPYKDKDKDKDILKDKGLRIVKDKEKEKKPYGEFGKVLLTDNEHEKLEQHFKEHYSNYIQDLDLYIEGSGKKYKSHYAVIRQWLNRDQIQEQKTEREKTEENIKAEEEIADIVNFIENMKNND